jgi:hypothetical protein
MAFRQRISHLHGRRSQSGRTGISQLRRPRMAAPRSSLPVRERRRWMPWKRTSALNGGYTRSPVRELITLGISVRRTMSACTIGRYGTSVWTGRARFPGRQDHSTDLVYGRPRIPRSEMVLLSNPARVSTAVGCCSVAFGGWRRCDRGLRRGHRARRLRSRRIRAGVR